MSDIVPILEFRNPKQGLFILIKCTDIKSSDIDSYQ
jgi:hypothetical protein